LDQSASVLRAIREAREELSPYLQRLDFEAISQHNRGYLYYAKDPVKSFVDQELDRFLYTLNFVVQTFPKGSNILDIGLFIPIVPVALTKLGFHVESVENLAFYDNALDEIITFISSEYGISVINLDILTSNLESLSSPYDAVFLLAILEHLNGTPKYLLERAKQLVKPDGFILIELPNVAALRNRLVFLLKGYPPYPPYPDYFNSLYPFTGHNREYTIKDLEYAIEHCGLHIEKIRTFHHVPAELEKHSFTSRIIRLLEQIGPSDWRPLIWAAVKFDN
jgi:2-polyprenyl-3-methyl-5-hydroxy-6-metoxy-1,4-benzoquinol methylase